MPWSVDKPYQKVQPPPHFCTSTGDWPGIGSVALTFLRVCQRLASSGKSERSPCFSWQSAIQSKPLEFLSFRSSLGEENLIIKISKVLVFERHIFYTFVGPLFVDNAIDSWIVVRQDACRASVSNKPQQSPGTTHCSETRDCKRTSSLLEAMILVVV